MPRSRAFVADLLETMYEADGIGLAATQVNVQQRILVIDVSDDRNEPYCLINPEIVSATGTESREEGCLSVPGFYETVDARRAYQGQGARSRRAAVRARGRRPAGGLRPARDRSSRRQAVRRLCVRAQTRAHQEASVEEEQAGRRVGRRRGGASLGPDALSPRASRCCGSGLSDGYRIGFAGTPEFAVPAFEALLGTGHADPVRAHPTRPAAGPRTCHGAVTGHAAPPVSAAASGAARKAEPRSIRWRGERAARPRRRRRVWAACCRLGCLPGRVSAA